MFIRMCDVIISVAVILTLSPLLFLVAITLKFTGEGKVFYRQIRIGQFEEAFGLLKFATMLENSPNIGSGTITIKDDPRVLPCGHILRVTKINELPQLYNILVGEMSIVGPRPLTQENWDLYTQVQRKNISSIKPGITGVGSIYFRDEEKYFNSVEDPKVVYKREISPRKAKCEEWYVKNKNLGIYVIIIIATAYTVFNKNSVFIRNYIEQKLDL